MVSFEAVSLFTNIYLNKTINIIADYGFSNDNTHIPIMDKPIFMKLLCLASKGLFLYKDHPYKQINGIANKFPL